MKLVLGILLIVAVSLWAFEGTTANVFVWDTVHSLYRNEDHISSLGIENIYWMLTSLAEYNWHPLTWFSFAIDYQLYGGLNTAGYHLTNNVIHALNSSLVFILILVVFGLNRSNTASYPISSDNHSLIAAALAAVIFAVHPQHVESVAWVFERKDLLCQFFLLLSFLTYVKYVTCQKDTKIWWFLITLGLFSMALLSKPMAVTLPAILLLTDIYPLRRTVSSKPFIQSIPQRRIPHLILEKIPFLILSIFVVLVTLQAQQSALANVSLDLRILNAFNSVILYLQKLAIPLHFSPHYPYFVNATEPVTFKTFVPFIGFLAITSMVVLAWLKGQRAWMIAWLFYLVALSPVLGLIQVGSQGAADRYAYLPTLPAYILIGTGILMALNHSTTRRYFVLVIAFTVITGLVFVTRQQVQVWENDLTLWSQAVKSYPRSVFARNNLAITHLNQGHYEVAAYHFERSEELSPNLNEKLAWRGLAYLFLGRYQDALQDHINLGVAAENNPDLDVDQYCIQYNIGWIYAQLNMPEQAVELMRRVGPDSRLGADATTWLNYLENANKTADGALVTEGLPVFCKTLINSRVWINGELQDQTQ